MFKHSLLIFSVCFCAASGEPTFSARFFLVVVELTPTGRSLLHMWHLHLAARPITMGGYFEQKTYSSQDVGKKLIHSRFRTSPFYLLFCLIPNQIDEWHIQGQFDSWESHKNLKSTLLLYWAITVKFWNFLYGIDHWPEIVFEHPKKLRCFDNILRN